MKRILLLSLLSGAAFLVSQRLPLKPVVDASTQQQPPLMAGPALTIAAAGRIEPASEEIHVGADFHGRLQQVLVEEGQLVDKGAVLAVFEHDELRARHEMALATISEKQAVVERLTNGSRSQQRRDAEAAVREADAVLELARAELTRRTQLRDYGVISRVEFDVAERDFRVAAARHQAAVERAALVEDETRPEDLRRAYAELERARSTAEEAKAMLEKATVRAPIRGVILRRNRHPGERISQLNDAPIVIMGDCSRLRVRAEIDENDVTRVRLAQSAWIRADAFGNRSFGAKVIRIGNMLGRKSIRTDEPAERMDAKVLETLLELDPGVPIPVGMRVDVFIQP